MKKRGKDRPVSLIELCVDRAGYRRGGKVMAFVVAWQKAEQDLGRRPSVEEYAEWWKQPRRTAFNELEYFREAFPEFAYPDELLEQGQRSATAIDTGAAVTA